MKSVIGFLGPLAFKYIYAFPIILVLIRIGLDKKLQIRNKEAITYLTGFICYAAFGVSEILLLNGDIASYFILIWFTLILPVSIAFFLFTAEADTQSSEEVNESSKKSYGFSHKTVIILCLSIVVSLTIVIYDTIRSTSVVLDYHRQFFDRLSDSKDKKAMLLEETLQPWYMSEGIIEDIYQIKDNEAYISFALPWRIGIAIRADTYGALKYWRFEYVKDYERWRLEGLFSTSTHYKN